MDRIELSEFEVHAVIGVLASEQVRTQRVRVELEMSLDLARAGDRADLSASVNYASVRDQLRFLIQTGHWPLLETIAVAACRLLLAPPSAAEQRAAIEQVRIRLRKPEILDDAVPGVVMTRATPWAEANTRVFADAEREPAADVLVETPRAGAYRLQLRPDQAWEVPPGAACMVIAGRARGEAVYASGDSIARMAETTLRGDGPRGACLLVVSIPPLRA